MIEGVIKTSPTCTVSEDNTIALSIDTRLAKPIRGRSSTTSRWSKSNRNGFLDNLQEAYEIAANSRLTQFMFETKEEGFDSWDEEALNRSWAFDVDSIVRAGIDHLQSQNNMTVERALPEEERIGSTLNWDKALKRDFRLDSNDEKKYQNFQLKMIYNDLIRSSHSSRNDVNDNGKRGPGSTSSTIEDSAELPAQLAQNTLFATIPTFATIAVPTYSLSAIVPPTSSGNEDNIVDIESMSFQFVNILGKYGEGTYLENGIDLEEDASLISQALKGAFETASILRNYQNGEGRKELSKE